MDIDRRTVLSTAAALGGAGLAGCTGDDGDEDDDCPQIDQEPTYGGWLAETSNYRRTCDFRERDEVSVTVGAQGNRGYYAFAPAAVAVSTGTTVTWEWTGRGGAHDVRERADVFDSGRPVDDDGKTYEVTFEDPGLFKYFCSPHRSLGMKGAVFVALE